MRVSSRAGHARCSRSEHEGGDRPGIWLAAAIAVIWVTTRRFRPCSRPCDSTCIGIVSGSCSGSPSSMTAETIQRVITTLGVAESVANPWPVPYPLTMMRSSSGPMHWKLSTSCCPQSRNQMVLPLAEGLPPQELVRRLGGTFPQVRKEIDTRLQEIVDGPNFWLTPWVKAAALASIAQLPAPTLASSVLGMLDSPEPLIRESAVWTLASLDTTAYQHPTRSPGRRCQPSSCPRSQASDHGSERRHANVVHSREGYCPKGATALRGHVG